MRLLLDTHVAIWVLTKPSLIPAHIRKEIDETPEDVFISSISIFEIATKFKLKRNDSPPFNGAEAAGYFEEMHFQFLSVTPQHAATVDQLEPFHSDPFDRLLIAQAIAEPMYLISNDAMIALYDCPRIPWQ
ncbi:type II toxin-antitoxin system VapC family toxin [Rhizobium sp. LjRoot254]|uniref:type II toxin-antitoxin system VapC family toxin n=1 Tax=Rhizobium sp. LjRoot254 TaxID=3342297 RepID=UPI003ECD6361